MPFWGAINRQGCLQCCSILLCHGTCNAQMHSAVTCSKCLLGAGKKSHRIYHCPTVLSGLLWSMLPEAWIPAGGSTTQLNFFILNTAALPALAEYTLSALCSKPPTQPHARLFCW